jgi:hypothetical protein
MRRSGHIGVAQAKVDDIFASSTRFVFKIVNDPEHIGRKTFYA